MPPLRVLLVGPSLDILGGRAVQAARLLERLREVPGVQVDFLAVNPRLPGPLAALQRVKYARTVATSIADECTVWGSCQVPCHQRPTSRFSSAVECDWVAHDDLYRARTSIVRR